MVKDSLDKLALDLEKIQFLEEPPDGISFLLLADMYGVVYPSYPTTTRGSKSLGLQVISASTVGVPALAQDLFYFEITSQVPEELSKHVLSSNEAQANWYRKLLEAWKNAKLPPKTTEEAARLVTQTLKKNQQADVEGLLAFYGLDLKEIQFFKEPPEGVSLLLLVDMHGIVYPRFLYGHWFNPNATRDSELVWPLVVSGPAVGVPVLAQDLFYFEITSQVPEVLGKHVVSSNKAQTNWYRELLEAWKEAKPPPKTTEEAARLVIQTLKKNQQAEVEGLLAFYGLGLEVIPFFEEPLDGTSLLLLVDMHGIVYPRFLYGHCFSSATIGNSESLGPQVVSSSTVGVPALAKDLFYFEITSEVPKGLHKHVVSSKKAQAKWYRKLLEAWKEAKPPPKTTEEAARLVSQTFKKNQHAVVVGLLAFYGLDLKGIQFFEEPPGDISLFLLVDLHGIVYPRFLYGHCFNSTITKDSETLRPQIISGPALGVSALAQDLFYFEITSQVPEGLGNHVVSSNNARAYCYRSQKRYRKLLEAWKQAKSPPKTREEAARLVILTLKKNRQADVEGLLAFYGLPLPHALIQLSTEIHTSWPEGVQFELHTLPVHAKAVGDGDGMTVYVSTADPRESGSIPSAVLLAAAQRSKARAGKDYTTADALHLKITDSGYRVINHQNQEILARKYRLRLMGIDAPEMSMPYGDEAKEELVNLVQGKCLRVLVYGEDKYGRTIGDVYCNGIFVQEEMLKKGFAWHHKVYDKRPEFAAWEKEAQAKQVGLWASPNPEKPWEWKQNNKREDS
ncbi:hypothetical protein SLEP1_g5963 [Rubroshorea leprosula]|uniref:TNase-like domain-containing protein n=2 Tax=Rubroshorea leprosula TaxID=152421 RepID=A0AAV5I4E5_9ROSI|nr:hypothetical protein SLEP1_g5963 [Rubroshorea leprosula]